MIFSKEHCSAGQKKDLQSRGNQQKLMMRCAKKKRLKALRLNQKKSQRAVSSNNKWHAV